MMEYLQTLRFTVGIAYILGVPGKRLENNPRTLDVDLSVARARSAVL